MGRPKRKRRGRVGIKIDIPRQAEIDRMAEELFWGRILFSAAKVVDKKKKQKNFAE